MHRNGIFHRDIKP